MSLQKMDPCHEARMDISPSLDIPSLLKYQNPLDRVPNELKRETQKAPLDSRAPGERHRPDRELRSYFPEEYEGKVSTGKIATNDHNRIEKEIERDPERKRLYKASREFQAIFINIMLKSMRSTLHRKDELFYAGNQQDIFEDMLYNEYSREMSRSPGFNLADEIYSQLSLRLPPLKEDASSGAREEGTGEEGQSKDAGKAMRGKARENYEKNLPPAGSIPTGNLRNEWEWSP